MRAKISHQQIIRKIEIKIRAANRFYFPQPCSKQLIPIKSTLNFSTIKTQNKSINKSSTLSQLSLQSYKIKGLQLRDFHV